MFLHLWFDDSLHLFLLVCYFMFYIFIYAGDMPIHDIHDSLVVKVTLRPRGNEPLGETWAEGRVFAVGDCNYGYLAGRFLMGKIWGENEVEGWG